MVAELGNRRWQLKLHITAAHMYAQARSHAQTVAHYEEYLSLRRELGEDDALEPFEAAEYAVALANIGRSEDALTLCERYEPLARDQRRPRALADLIWAHLKAISDLKVTRYSTMSFAKYGSYMGPGAEAALRIRRREAGGR